MVCTLRHVHSALVTPLRLPTLPFVPVPHSHLHREGLEDVLAVYAATGLEALSAYTMSGLYSASSSSSGAEGALADCCIVAWSGGGGRAGRVCDIAPGVGGRDAIPRTMGLIFECCASEGDACLLFERPRRGTCTGTYPSTADGVPDVFLNPGSEEVVQAPQKAIPH
ncbi:hypothetical protein C8J57DRAFT_1612555 [Mycena rebaudengoi]|nr:hypothetical protein C8J57DRAFT_1612555 [Mycena rebaudengoi]